jgi:hypothetical protein
VDRELDYRPSLSWKVNELVRNGAHVVDPGKMTVANFGRGPALHALCCLAWRMSTDGDQGPAGPVGAQGPWRRALDMATTVLFDLSPGEQGQPGGLPLERRDGQMADDDIAGNPQRDIPSAAVEFIQSLYAPAHAAPAVDGGVDRCGHCRTQNGSISLRRLTQPSIREVTSFTPSARAERERRFHSARDLRRRPS